MGVDDIPACPEGRIWFVDQGNVRECRIRVDSDCISGKRECLGYIIREGFNAGRVWYASPRSTGRKVGPFKRRRDAVDVLHGVERERLSK